MASIVLSSIGTSVGNMVLPGLGGRLLGSVSRRAGKALDSAWGWGSTSQPKDGARLENFKVQDSRYGTAIPVPFGQTRIAGNLIWVSDLIETSHEEEVGGGKGGTISGAFSNTRTTYTYSLHCAVALCAGEIGGIQTIWADSKIIYQNGVWKTGIAESATFYTGATTQNVDPLLESWIGEGLVPAYRGLAYVVFESLQLSNFGNRLPNLTFEILPKESTGQPSWLGSCDSDLMHVIGTNRNGGMRPIVIEGGSISARRMLVGGYALQNDQARFDIVEYDVTGFAPLEVTRTQSAAFPVSGVGDHSWALARDKRFVAVGLQDGDTSKTYRVALYDAQTRQFGETYAVSMSLSDMRQIAWIDAQRFVVMDERDGKRGVRVFMRSGLSVVDLGFVDVWGAGSVVSRVVEMHAQCIPFADGLFQFVVDSAPDFTVMEGRHLSWLGNKLSVGAKLTLTTGADMGNGNGSQTFFLKGPDQDWILFYGSTLEMRLLSFRLGKEGFQIVRPWQRLANSGLSDALCHAPVVIGNRIVVLQRFNYENFYRISEIEIQETSFALAKNAEVVEGLDQVAINFGVASIDATKLLVSGNLGYAGDLGRLDIVKRRNTGDTLDNVVAKILHRAGYHPSDYDVTALSGLPVDGYVLSDQMTGEGALSPLQILEPFDLIESDGQLKAVRRVATEAAQISLDEAGASSEEESDKPATILVSSRAQEIALPVEITIDYQDATRDYEINSQKARRAVTKGSRDVAKATLPLVCSPSQAKRVAENQLFRIWSERTRYHFTLSRSWVRLEPGDVVVLGDHRARVQQVQIKAGVLVFEAISCAETPLASVAYAESGGGLGASVSEPIATTLYLMDLPLLRPEDDQPGLYAAVSGLDGWPGAGLWRAADGVNYTSLASFSTAATAGAAVTALQQSHVAYMDRSNALRVQLLRGTLSSCTMDDLFNGANAALVGAEIIQFQSATLLGPGLYELRNLLRGRQGTEEAVALHTVGEGFVLLSSSAVQFLPAQISDRNRSYSFRAVTTGQTLGLAQDIAAAYGLKTLQPLAPAHLQGLRVGGQGTDLTIKWIRRARKNAAWVDYVDVPLDEKEEKYDVEIVDSGTGVTMRTFADVSETMVIYTAAQQAADWDGSIPSSFTVRVCQQSALYGRGLKASSII